MYFAVEKKNKKTAIVLKGYRQGWPGNTSGNYREIPSWEIL
jgi:hypothetical protein